MSAGAEECVTFPSQNNNGHCSGVLIGMFILNAFEISVIPCLEHPF